MQYGPEQLARRFTDVVLGIDAPDAADPGPITDQAIKAGIIDPWMIEHLRQAEGRLRRFRQRLEAEIGSRDRLCPVCGGTVLGRADRLYCSSACRQSAHRRRHAA